MSGKIKATIDKIVEERAKGSETIRATTRTKLMLKGINVKNYTGDSKDDPEVLARLQQIAIEFGVKL